MLNIAVIGPYAETRRFIFSKFKNQILNVNYLKGEYILTNGDRLLICSSNDPNSYISSRFDAYVNIGGGYKEVELAILSQCLRPLEE